jgi:phage baseplate assembly protein W
MSGLAAKLPLSISPDIGAYEALNTIKEVAAQNIKMIVFTNPGERVMDAFFGVGVRRYLFRQNTLETHSYLKAKIKKQIAKYLPYVKIEKLHIDSTATNPQLPENFIKVVLQYKISPYNISSVLELPVSA